MMDGNESMNTKTIWLMLLKEGGRWTANEIAKEFGSTSDYVCRVINQMASRGYIRRHERPCERHAYSVDKTCKIPLQTSLSDLLNAGVEIA